MHVHLTASAENSDVEYERFAERPCFPPHAIFRPFDMSFDAADCSEIVQRSKYITTLFQTRLYAILTSQSHVIASGSSTRPSASASTDYGVWLFGPDCCIGS